MDKLKEVKQRLRGDTKYAKAMSDVVHCSFFFLTCLNPPLLAQVVDRLAIIRSHAKAEATKNIAHYQLGLGEGCKE